MQALIQRPSGATAWNGPYLRGEGVPVDPWNRPYDYRSPSTRSGRDFDLCSRGPDGDGAAGNLICNQ